MLVPADVEYTVQEYLKGHNPGVMVSTRFTDADQIIHLFSTGGDGRTIVSGAPRLVFDCYAKREAQAWNLAARVHGLVSDLDSRMVAGVQFYDIEATLPSNYPHPDRPDYYRYQFNAVIHARHVGTN